MKASSLSDILVTENPVPLEDQIQSPVVLTQHFTCFYCFHFTYFMRGPPFFSHLPFDIVTNYVNQAAFQSREKAANEKSPCLCHVFSKDFLLPLIPAQFFLVQIMRILKQGRMLREPRIFGRSRSSA